MSLQRGFMTPFFLVFFDEGRGKTIGDCLRIKIADMKNPLKPLSTLVVLFTALLSSCYIDDPGPLQEVERQYAIVDFNRLEMGDAFHIEVEHGNFFEVNVRGDRRNVDDLTVKKEGSTLVIRYSKHRQRRHDTYIRITMPELHAVNFSGASESRVYGFSEAGAFDVYLSGASVCQLDVEAEHLRAVLSGASYLSIRGVGEELVADVSGASALKAFNFPVAQANVSLSGASDGKVTVTDVLDVNASGASHLVYRGNPALSSDLSGSSSVHQE